MTRVSREEFLNAYITAGRNALRTAQKLGIHIRTVQARLSMLRAQDAPELVVDQIDVVYPEKLPLRIDEGVVLLGADLHAWPGVKHSLALRGFVHACQALKPAAVILNGDIFDGARISRHGRIGWMHAPAVRDELAAVKQALAEIEAAAPDAELLRTIGNHDERIDTLLANNADQFEQVHGFRLKDHLPAWAEAWSYDINDQELIVMHKWHQGIHASYNNLLKGGASICTAHTHRGKIETYTNFVRRAYALELGMLGPAHGPQFRYRRGTPSPWAEGFGVCTFRRGRLLPPEMAEVQGDEVIFRGDALVSAPKRRRRAA
jgi:DNA-binding CsgD family transcriptional regulator